MNPSISNPDRAAPLVTLESDPDLPEVDVFSYLLLGVPAQDMTAMLGGSQSGGIESQAAGLTILAQARQVRQRRFYLHQFSRESPG